jgi:hypothetical protein
VEKTYEINKRYIEWLIQRMIHKHSEDMSIISPLYSILESIKPKQYNIDLSDSDLDKIISKYYIDFRIDKTKEMNIGFSCDDREKFRNTIKLMIADVINKNIPEDLIIKDNA